MSKRHILIVCNGEDYCINKIIEYSSSCDYIICADGGLKILDELSIKPDLIIGDMDSMDEKIIGKYKNVTIEKYPVDKDITDSELAVKKALSLKPEKILLLAATGSYFDHSFANVINLIKYNEKGIDLSLITKNSIIMPVIKMKVINNSIGRRFSVFSVGKNNKIFISGCKYKFSKNKKFTIYDYSISNIIDEDEFVVKLKKGFIVLFDKGYN